MNRKAGVLSAVVVIGMLVGAWVCWPAGSLTGKALAVTSGEGAAQVMDKHARLTESTHEGSAGPVSGKAKALRQLPFEARLMKEGGLSADMVANLIGGKQFDTFVNQAMTDAAGDADARDLGESYRREFETLLAGMPGLRLEKLVCGLSTCVGAVSAMGKQGAQNYDAWRSKLEAPGAVPAYSWIDSGVRMGSDMDEHRFVFSVDQSVNSIHMAR